jgi:Trk K+ transport system NAD-binding subunit
MRPRSSPAGAILDANPELREKLAQVAEWNLEAIHRAGADFALSHGFLAVQTLVALVRGRELIVLGEGTELLVEKTSPHLFGKRLSDSRIGSETDLNVVVRESGRITVNPPTSMELLPGSGLVMIGSPEQGQSFLAMGKES